MCKLVKSLYGLKQAPRCWDKKFVEFLSRYEFKPSEADQCVFVGKLNKVKVYLALFVDDGLLAATSMDILQTISSELDKTFNITIGNAKIFVGLQIEKDRDAKTLWIHQEAYARKVVERFGMTKSKSVGILADPHAPLLPVEEKSDEKKRTI